MNQGRRASIVNRSRSLGSTDIPSMTSTPEMLPANENDYIEYSVEPSPASCPLKPRKEPRVIMVSVGIQCDLIGGNFQPGEIWKQSPMYVSRGTNAMPEPELVPEVNHANINTDLMAVDVLIKTFSRVCQWTLGIQQ